MGPRTPCLVVLPAVLAACAAFDGVFGDSTSDTGTTAPTAGDAGLEADAGEADGASVPGAKSLIDGTFEQSGASRCAGASSVRATAVPDPLAATGKVACRVCATAEATSGTIGELAFVVTPAPAGRYRLAFSARKAPNDTPSPGDLTALLLAHRNGQYLSSGPSATVRPVVYPEYRRYEFVHEVGDGADDLTAVILVFELPGECLLIDDVTLTRE